MGIILSANTNQFINDLILPSGTTFSAGTTELIAPDGPFTIEDIRASVELQNKIDSGDIVLSVNGEIILNNSTIGINSIPTFGTTISGGTPSSIINNQNFYRTTNNLQTNINSSTAWNPVNFKTIPTINSDTNIFEGVTNGVLLKKDLTYKISSNVFYTATSARVNNPISIALDGVVQDIEGASGYVRNASGHNTASVHVSDIFELSAGTVVTIVSRREGAAGTSTHTLDKSNLVIECFDSTSGETAFFPKPIITEVRGGTISSGTTQTITLNGGYITETTTISVPSTTVGNVVVIDDDSLTFDISGTTLGFFDIIVTSEGGTTTITNGIEVVNNTWIDLSSSGPSFTNGNGAGNDIRYQSSMGIVRDANGMNFTGANPWTSWVKFEIYPWTRGDNRTLEWILTPPTAAMMIGIGSDATNETSTAQYAQAECEAYINSTTNFWGLYGNNGTIGSAGNQNVNTSIAGWAAIKVKFEGDGSQGELFTLYGLNTTGLGDWNDESNVLATFTVGGTLNPDESNLFPFIIPRDSTQRIIAMRLI